MIVNNFSTLSLYFNKLENKDDFYYVQVIQRKKDGHEKSERNIKNFYFYNKVDFLNAQDYIISLCHQYNARAYFWVNPRNARSISAACIKEFADLLIGETCIGGHTIWDRMCGAHSSPNGIKKWIVDIDTKDSNIIQTIIKLINECNGNPGNRILDSIPTAQGVHLLVFGFNIHQFKQLCIINKIPTPDIHKNNFTLLYYAKDGRENL